MLKFINSLLSGATALADTMGDLSSIGSDYVASNVALWRDDIRHQNRIDVASQQMLHELKAAQAKFALSKDLDAAYAKLGSLTPSEQKFADRFDELFKQ